MSSTLDRADLTFLVPLNTLDAKILLLQSLIPTAAQPHGHIFCSYHGTS
jgi:hypothetical protein